MPGGHFPWYCHAGMDDERFERTVIFVWAHSQKIGAMGFISNRRNLVQFQDS